MVVVDVVGAGALVGGDDMVVVVDTGGVDRPPVAVAGAETCVAALFVVAGDAVGDAVVDGKRVPTDVVVAD